MNYKMMCDISFVDKLDESLKYIPGDVIKTPVNENRMKYLVENKMAHVIKKIVISNEKTKNTEKEKDKEKINDIEKEKDNEETKDIEKLKNSEKTESKNIEKNEK